MCSVVMCPRSTVNSKVLALLRRCFSVSCPACLSPQSSRVRPAGGDRADRVDCQRTTRKRLPSSRKIRFFVLLRIRSFQRTVAALLMSANCSDKGLSLSGRPHANTPFLPFRKNSRGTTATHVFLSFAPSAPRLVFLLLIRVRWGYVLVALLLHFPYIFSNWVVFVLVALPTFSVSSSL